MDKHYIFNIIIIIMALCVISNILYWMRYLKRKPVKRSKDRCHVVILFGVCYYSSSTILNSLKSTYIIVRHAIQQGIAVINARCNECMGHCEQCLMSQIWLHAPDVPEMEIGHLHTVVT